jgi:hypothetical protein
MYFISFIFLCCMALSAEIESIRKIEGLTEHPDDKIYFSASRKNDKIEARDVIDEGDGLLLRSYTDEGSIIKFLDTNPYDQWSFTFTIESVPLRYPHVGGVYLWYTFGPNDKGKYRGGRERFKGVMVGIEFTGSQPDLVLAFNDGSVSLLDTETMTLMRDSLNPDRLRGIKDIMVKVISTNKNFKLEVYSGEKILYDRFRYFNRSNLGDRGAGGYFSITSFYDKVPSEKAYKLKGAQLNERIENEEYKVSEVHTPVLPLSPRPAEDIAHENEEIRHLVAKFEFLNEYLNLVLGHPHDSSFDKVVTILSNAFKAQEQKVGEIIGMLKEKNSGNVNARLLAINERMNSIDLKLQRIQKSMSEADHIIKSIGRGQSRYANLLNYVVIVVGVASITLIILRELFALKLRRKAL